MQKKLGDLKVRRGNKEIDRFNHTTHIKCWMRYNVRPKGGAERPEKTDSRYCVYDKLHKDYLYTKEWVSFLCEKLKDEQEYAALYVSNAGDATT